jgi:hypothetical protein
MIHFEKKLFKPQYALSRRSKLNLHICIYRAVKRIRDLIFLKISSPDLQDA